MRQYLRGWVCVWNDCEFQAFPDCFSAKWSNAISRLIFRCLYNKTLLLKPVVVVASPIECSSLCSVTVDTSCCPPRFFCVLMLLSSFLAVPSRVLSIRKVELEFFVFIRCEQKHVKWKKMVSKCCWRDNPKAKNSPEGDVVNQNGSTSNLLDFEETCDKKLDAAETKRRSSTASSTTGSGISAFQKYSWCRHCKTFKNNSKLPFCETF